MLLSLSGAFGPLHPGVRTAWLQWGRDFLRLPSMVATSDEDESESEDVPLNVSSVSGGGGGGGGAGAGATTLGQSSGGSHLDKDKGKGKGILKGTWTRDPLSSPDPALRASMRGK